MSRLTIGSSLINVWITRLVSRILSWKFLIIIGLIMLHTYCWFSIDTDALLLHLLIDYLYRIVFDLAHGNLRVFQSNWLMLNRIIIPFSLFVVTCVWSLMLSHLSCKLWFIFAVFKRLIFRWFINCRYLPWFRWQSQPILYSLFLC